MTNEKYQKKIKQIFTVLNGISTVDALGIIEVVKLNLFLDCYKASEIKKEKPKN